MNFNKVILVGRATKDVEIRKTNDGKSVASITIATNNVYVDKSGQKVEKTDFHNIVIWGTVAEAAAKFCVKGTTIMVEGRLQNRSYEAQDGTKRNVTEVIAERFQLGPGPKQSSPATVRPPQNTGDEPSPETRVENIPF